MIILLMGVAGSGKTKIGKMLGDRLGWRFYDGDDYHPENNIRKMSSGIPLTDEDRTPWLLRLNAIMRETTRAGENIIVGSSALKQSYRDILGKGVDDLRIVYLKGSFDLLFARMQKRRGHYMKPEMLQSQFDALEEPQDALTIDVTAASDAVVSQIMKAFSLNLQ